MAGKPREHSPPDSPQRTPAHEPGKFDQSDEMTGPLAVERLRKSDGRTLILYTLTPCAAKKSPRAPHAERPA